MGPVRGVRGIGVHWGGKWTGSPTTLGPSPGSHHFHWFHLGSDLPGQGQASDRNELCRLLYTFETIFHDSLHICIYATSSHILTHNVKKFYTDYFLCRPITHILTPSIWCITTQWYKLQITTFLIRHLRWVHLTANVKLT